MKTIESIKRFIARRFYPKSQLSRELIILLTVHGIFLLAVGLSNTFINIFLWKVEKDLQIIVLFNAIHFATVPFVFTVGGWMAKKVSVTVNLRIGIFCYSILYMLLLVLQDRVANFVWLLGVLLGTSGGFYYLSYNVLGYDFSTDDNRDYVMSVQGFVLSIATMIAPFTAGFIIEGIQGIKGYILIFSISLVLFIISAIISTRIPTIKVKKQYYLKSLLLMPLKNKNWRYVLLGESIRGFREGIMMFLTGTLLYAIINSEWVVGSLTLVSSAVQLSAFYYISKRLKPYNRKAYLLIGTLAIVLVSSIFLLEVSVLTLWIYGTVSSFFIPFVNNPTAALIYWVIHKMPNSTKRRIEGIVVREVYLNVGRVVGTLLLLMVSPNAATAEGMFRIAVIIFLLGLSQIVMWYLFHKVKVSS